MIVTKAVTVTHANRQVALKKGDDVYLKGNVPKGKKGITVDNGILQKMKDQGAFDIAKKSTKKDGR